MNHRNILVTGANRGIGLEFVRQILKQANPPKNLIATTRKQSPELEQLKSEHNNLHILTYDATNYDDYNNFFKNVESIVKDEGLDLLINNAGVAIRAGLNDFTAEKILKNVEINAAAPMMLIQTLLPLLKTSAKNGHKTMIVNISSLLGSIESTFFGGFYPYRASKAALNMMSKVLSVDLKDENIIVLILHPGWVKTDLGGPNAMIEKETSVEGMLNVINAADSTYNGKFIDYNGKPMSW